MSYVEEKSKSVPMHVPENLIYDNFELTGKEANQIIEEIVVILTKWTITTMTAKRILEDTINAIEKETILGDRIVDGVIIRADQSFPEASEPDVHTQV